VGSGSGGYGAAADILLVHDKEKEDAFVETVLA
jgi:ABC-type tungstate transport system permease subunit